MATATPPAAPDARFLSEEPSARSSPRPRAETVCGLSSSTAVGDGGRSGAKGRQAAGRRRSRLEARSDRAYSPASPSPRALPLSAAPPVLHASATAGSAEANSSALWHAEMNDKVELLLLPMPVSAAAAVAAAAPALVRARTAAEVAADRAPVAEGIRAVVLPSLERARGSAESSAACFGERLFELA